MSIQYINPPLIEALVDFKFSPDTTWDTTIPGQLYADIKHDFRKSSPKRNIRLSVDIADKAAHIGTDEWIVFEHTRHSIVVQIAPQRLSINNTKHYLGWEKLIDIIEDLYSKYERIKETGTLEYITLRYINMLHINPESLIISDYFTLYPHFDTEVYPQFTGFIVGLQPVINDGDLRIELQSLANTDTARSSFMLDIEYSIHISSPLQLEDIKDILNRAHTEVEKAFNEVLTQKVKDSFGIQRERI